MQKFVGFCLVVVAEIAFVAAAVLWHTEVADRRLYISLSTIVGAFFTLIGSVVLIGSETGVVSGFDTMPSNRALWLVGQVRDEDGDYIAVVKDPVSKETWAVYNYDQVYTRTGFVKFGSTTRNNEQVPALVGVAVIEAPPASSVDKSDTEEVPVNA